MKKIFIIVFLAKICVVYAQNPQTDKNWKLSWKDNFDYFNNNIWMKANDCSHGNEPQLYLSENVWAEKGVLKIRIKSDSVNCHNQQSASICWSCEDKKYNYSSGWIETHKNYCKKFGYIESRMKIPHRNGFWPAFWTYRLGELPNAGEIDIFEMYGCKGENHIETNIHHSYSGNVESRVQYLQKIDIEGFSYTDWHKYAIEWDSKKIIWYVDDIPIRITYNHNMLDSVSLIINLALLNTKKCNTTIFSNFEDYMLIDYIKTYTLKCDNQSVIFDIADFNTFDFSVKKSITLSGNTIIPTSSYISLRATDYIELQPGFEVPVDGNLYLDVCQCNEEQSTN